MSTRVIDAQLQPAAPAAGEIELTVRLSRAGYDNLCWAGEQLAKLRPDLRAELSSPQQLLQSMAAMFENRSALAQLIQAQAGLYATAAQAQQKIEQIRRAGEDLISLGKAVLRKGGRRR